MRQNHEPFEACVSGVDIFETRSHVDRFWRTSFHKKWTKIPNREHDFFPFPKEARPCLSRNHNRASRGSKTLTLVEGKKQKTRFFPFPRGTAVTLAKAQPWLSRKQNRDSHKRENTETRIFFPFREARPWLSRKHNRASHGSKTVTLAKEKKNRNAYFFPLRVAWPWLLH